MAGTNGNILKLYNSGTDGQAPSAGNLAYGELAINYNNEKLYYKNSGDTLRALLLMCKLNLVQLVLLRLVT
jgi:hypothetical protein